MNRPSEPLPPQFVGNQASRRFVVADRKGREILRGRCVGLALSHILPPPAGLLVAGPSRPFATAVTMGLHTIIMAHVVFNLAFVCSVVRARLKSFDWSIVEASQDLGASGLTTLCRVVLPVLMPAVIAGTLLAFTLSVDEFIIAFFTAGAGRASTTLPMQIFAMIRFGVTPEINALAALVMAVSLIALTLAQRLNRGGMVAP